MIAALSLTPRSRWWLCCFLLGSALTTAVSSYTYSYPIAHEIKAKHTQCITSRLQRGDFATWKVFVVDVKNDGRRSAAVQIEGPIANDKIGALDEQGNRQWDNAKLVDAAGMDMLKRKTNTMGAALQQSINNWPQFVQTNSKHFQESGIIHQAFHIDWTFSGESEDAIAARADFSRQKERSREEERQRRQRENKYSGNESVENEVYDETNRIEQIIPEYIEPFEWTKHIKAAGWYRLCVQAEDSISAELDIRSSAELGGVNGDTGHVFTWEEKQEMDEEQNYKNLEDEKMREELEEMLKGQVGDYDLQTTRRLMSEVNHVVSQIQKLQGEMKDRMKVHSGDARRNQKKIAKSGMIETVLYLTITLFQLWTIRRWLLSSNVLGR
ncbi:hypothetical protein THAOC_08074 [Thalassiosira oceanica]|uniref:GOLD domain-containing protein n=1 Tax=Thalassiosira oceanica TaxID=159749 RepID=K0SYS3_THAOC|nr:hypothetical protein THAOC_08074 [Thalassiosira oceanica]|eukprot:EJK70555.1 hypothetical protein THAOC_08074 [Thalassiosira oceanica]